MIGRGLERHALKARRWPFSIERELEQGAYLRTTRSTYTPTKTRSHVHPRTRPARQAQRVQLHGRRIAARVLEIRKEVVRESLSDFRTSNTAWNTWPRERHRVHQRFQGHQRELHLVRPGEHGQAGRIVGGVDKGNDYDALMELVRGRVKAIIRLGTDNAKLHEALRRPWQADDRRGFRAAGRRPPTTWVSRVTWCCSPACASFDLFENYEDRGRRFKAAVRGSEPQ